MMNLMSDLLSMYIHLPKYLSVARNLIKTQNLITLSNSHGRDHTNTPIYSGRFSSNRFSVIDEKPGKYSTRNTVPDEPTHLIDE